MGPDLILAMIVAAMLTRGYEQSKRRTRARWEQARAQARRDAQQRQKRAQARGKAFRARLTSARRKGPRDPLWWAYAAGWVASAAVRASYATVQGAREGSAAGAREGYRIGREGARKGWGYRQTWTEYRERRARQDPYGDSGAAREVPMDACAGCGVYVPASGLDTAGRCRTCAGDDEPKPERDAAGDEWTGTDPQPEDQPTDRHDTDEDGDPAPDSVPAETPGQTAGDGTTPSTQGDEPMSELATLTGQTGTGEGYSDTVATLETLAKQLKAAHETAQTLSENLTANEVDAQTITNVGELLDALDAAAPMADETAKHVVTRHEPVADAVAGAGGSQNVATKTWYDDH